MPWYANIIVPAGSLHAEEYIEQAMNLLPPSGGRVVLMEGEYTISRYIEINAAGQIVLEGQGGSTVIKGGFPIYSGSMIVPSSIRIKNLLLDEVSIVIGGCNFFIQDVKLKQAEFGIFGYNVSEFEISHVIIDAINDAGISLNDVISGTVRNCRIDNAGIIVYFSKNISISENVVTNGTDGIFVYESEYITITNNALDGTSAWYGDGIEFDTVNYSSVIGNTINKPESHGILIQDGVNNTVTGNNINQSGWDGVNLINTNFSTVNGNVVSESAWGGIVLSNSDDNVINSNTVIASSQYENEAKDNISLYDSSRNNVQENICRHGGGANQPRYGIALWNVGCNKNIVTNNDLLDSGSLSSLYDNGTDTVTTAGNRLF